MGDTKAGTTRCSTCRCHLLVQRTVKHPIRVCPFCDLVEAWPQTARGRWKPAQ